jgi:hypothetical protein
MNQPNDCRTEPDDDSALERALSSLKSIEPPLATRIQNRTAVAAALVSFMSANRRRHLPWWRRTISVPLPVAACFLLICALAVASRFRGDDDKSPLQMAVHDQRPLTAQGAGKAPTIADGRSDAHPVLVYRESATYLCGIGQLHSTRGYFFKEQDR